MKTITLLFTLIALACSSALAQVNESDQIYYDFENPIHSGSYEPIQIEDYEPSNRLLIKAKRKHSATFLFYVVSCATLGYSKIAVEACETVNFGVVTVGILAGLIAMPISLSARYNTRQAEALFGEYQQQLAEQQPISQLQLSTSNNGVGLSYNF